jgi:hypothetical protein
MFAEDGETVNMHGSFLDQTGSGAFRQESHTSMRLQRSAIFALHQW